VLERESGIAGELVPIRTAGDRGAGDDKSRFVKEIEEALLRGDVDLAVHSAKDVPGELPEGLSIVGAPPAEDARDALVASAGSIEELPAGARVGTSSLRRRSQLLAIRPDLAVTDLRGNVDTRLSKVAKGDFEAIVLALAGLRRLGRESGATPIDVEQMVPAPGQGVLALEAREGDARVAELARAISDGHALVRLDAERAAVVALEASCRTPIGVHARIDGERLRIHAFAGLPDGSEWIRDEVEGDTADAAGIAHALAERMIAAGADDLLRRA